MTTRRASTTTNSLTPQQQLLQQDMGENRAGEMTISSSSPRRSNMRRRSNSGSGAMLTQQRPRGLGMPFISTTKCTLRIGTCRVGRLESIRQSQSRWCCVAITNTCAMAIVEFSISVSTAQILSVRMYTCLHMCAHRCICMCMHVYVCSHTHTHTHTHTHMLKFKRIQNTSTF